MTTQTVKPDPAGPPTLPAAAAPTLEYCHPTRLLQPVPRLYRAAVWCAVLPMVAGTAVFLLWAMTRWEWLIRAGLLVILVGCLAFAIGITCLTVYWWRERRFGVLHRKTVERRLARAVLLLLSNFPLAYIYFVAVLKLL